MMDRPDEPIKTATRSVSVPDAVDRRGLREIAPITVNRLSPFREKAVFIMLHFRIHSGCRAHLFKPRAISARPMIPKSPIRAVLSSNPPLFAVRRRRTEKRTAPGSITKCFP
jgi:hypothetical protein